MAKSKQRHSNSKIDQSQEQSQIIHEPSLLQHKETEMNAIEADVELQSESN